MKKLYKMAMLVFVPIICGVILLVVGFNTDGEELVTAGIMTLQIGIPVTMFALIVISLVLIVTGKIDLSDYRRGPNADPDLDESKPESEREKERIEGVNTAYGYNSKYREAEHTAHHAANNYKNSTPKQKVFGWLFFGFLMTDFALILVFAFLRMWIGTIVCFSLFVGTLIISLIVVKLKETLSLRPRKHTPQTPSNILRGTVKACLLSSSTSVGGAERHSTTRMTDATYRVLIEGDGRLYTAYSKQFYDTGETVRFEAIGKHNAHIIEN